MENGFPGFVPMTMICCLCHRSTKIPLQHMSSKLPNFSFVFNLWTFCKKKLSSSRMGSQRAGGAQSWSLNFKPIQNHDPSKRSVSSSLRLDLSKLIAVLLRNCLWSHAENLGNLPLAPIFSQLVKRLMHRTQAFTNIPRSSCKL